MRLGLYVAVLAVSFSASPLLAAKGKDKTPEIPSINSAPVRDDCQKPPEPPPDPAIVSASPIPHTRTPPKYPKKEGDLGVGGKVVLRFDIAATGQVTNLKVLCSTRKSFVKFAVASVSQWVYTPATRNGRPIVTQGFTLLMEFAPHPSSVLRHAANPNRCLALSEAADVAVRPVDSAALTSPKLISKEPPVYPVMSEAQRVAGLVVIDYELSKRGKVVNPKVACADPAGQFEQAALDAVKKWRYEPAKRNGKAIAYPRMRVVVEFRLSDASRTQAPK